MPVRASPATLNDAFPDPSWTTVPKLATVEATTAILTGDFSAKFWIVLLAAYNVVFTTACLLLFDTVLNAE